MKIFRAAFTLIELLVIIGIMGSMVTVGVVSLNASRGSMRQFGAARDVMSMVRRARALALITQRPVVLTISNATVEGEACASVEIQAPKLFSGSKTPSDVWNLAGEIVIKAETSEGDDEKGGETIEEILSPESIPEDVLKGLRIKVLEENEELMMLPENEQRSSKISIFSTADNISRTLGGETPQAKKAEETDGDLLDDDLLPTKIAFAANGTVSPSVKIWIYREDSHPDNGICIVIDRFGEPKCEALER